MRFMLADDGEPVIDSVALSMAGELEFAIPVSRELAVEAVKTLMMVAEAGIEE